MKFKVIIWEYEKGWGSRIDETKIFDSSEYNNDADKALDAAKAFVKEFNSHNKSKIIPDWYMVAANPELMG